MRGVLLSILAILMAAPLAGGTQTLLVLGDSLSAAYGMDPPQGWVSLLEQRLTAHDCDYEVVNASISGDTTSGGLSRLPAALERHRPTIVVIELGANDGLRGLSLAAMRKNLIRMIQQSRAQGAKVLLLGVRLPANYGPAYTERFQAVYTDVAEKTGASLVQRFLAGVAENRKLMLADGVHPTVEAQPMILENVWRGLEPLLARCR